MKQLPSASATKCLNEYLPASLLSPLKIAQDPASHATYWVKKAITFYPTNGNQSSLNFKHTCHKYN